MIKSEGIYTKKKKNTYFTTIIPKKGNWITIKINIRIKNLIKIKIR